MAPHALADYQRNSLTSDCQIKFYDIPLSNQVEMKFSLRRSMAGHGSHERPTARERRLKDGVSRPD
jgi:hypothetical protein